MDERIRELAKEADAYADYYAFIADEPEKDIFVRRFAELIAAAEREACALVCEAIPFTYTRMDYEETCLVCATAIRARGDA